MKVLLVAFGLVACAKAGFIEGTGAEERIVNGEDAKLGEIPFQVSLQTTYGSHFCGGSILNKKFIITAAHCVKGKSLEEVIVVAATVNLDEPQLIRTVEKIIIHEQYDALSSWINDIALLKLDDEFVMTGLLNSVEIPSPHEVIPVEAVAVVSGWGNLQTGGPSPIILQKAKIQIADQDYCRKTYAHMYVVYKTHICAHDPNEKRGACNGDSGGPLIVNNKLVGIVSWSIGCALKSYPTVHTRVSEYLDWIESNVH